MDERINWEFARAKPSVPSDRLKSVYKLCEQFPILVEVFDLPEPFKLVADSNAAIREVLFTSKYRRNETARTDLRESLESGVLRIIAPVELKTEMDRHLPKLALEKGIAKAKLSQEWEELQPYIEFCEVVEHGLPSFVVADPDDIPFVSLYLSSNADAVLTYDKHISMMGAQVVKPDAIRFVRDYARSKAPEVSLRVGGVVIGGVALGSLVALVKLLVAAIRSFFKLPIEYQLLFIGGLIFAFAYPASRRVILNSLSSIASGFKIPANVFLEVVAELTVQFGEAQLQVKASQTILETTIPRRAMPLLPMEESSYAMNSVAETVTPTPVVAVTTNFPLPTRRRRSSTRSRRPTKRRTPRKRPAKLESHVT